MSDQSVRLEPRLPGTQAGSQADTQGGRVAPRAEADPASVERFKAAVAARPGPKAAQAATVAEQLIEQAGERQAEVLVDRFPRTMGGSRAEPPQAAAASVVVAAPAQPPQAAAASMAVAAPAQPPQAAAASMVVAAPAQPPQAAAASVVVAAPAQPPQAAAASVVVAAPAISQGAAAASVVVAAPAISQGAAASQTVRSDRPATAAASSAGGRLPEGSRGAASGTGSSGAAAASPANVAASPANPAGSPAHETNRPVSAVPGTPPTNASPSIGEGETAGGRAIGAGGLPDALADQSNALVRPLEDGSNGNDASGKKSEVAAWPDRVPVRTPEMPLVQGETVRRAEGVVDPAVLAARVADVLGTKPVGGVALANAGGTLAEALEPGRSGLLAAQSTTASVRVTESPLSGAASRAMEVTPADAVAPRGPDGVIRISEGQAASIAGSVIRAAESATAGLAGAGGVPSEATEAAARDLPEIPAQVFLQGNLPMGTIGPGMSQTYNEVAQWADMVSRVMVFDHSAGERGVLMALDQEPLKGVMVSLYEDGGRWVVECECPQEPPHHLLGGNAPALAGELAPRLGGPVLLRVMRADPEQRDLIEAMGNLEPLQGQAPVQDALIRT